MSRMSTTKTNHRKSYPSDITDDEWVLWEKVLPKRSIPPQFPDAKYSMREVINALKYRLHNGCIWRSLPHDFPPWTIVYYYFRTWRNQSFFAINTEFRRQYRATQPKKQNVLNDDNQPREIPAKSCEYRDPEPSLGVVDSQSVKGTSLSKNGYDGNKNINGRKRHILTDCLGIVLLAVVTTANVQDRDGFAMMTKNFKIKFPCIKKVLADGVYNGEPIRNFVKQTGIKVEHSKKPKSTTGFVPIWKRWVIERTFGWFSWKRLLGRCHERLPESEEAWIYLASASRLSRRLIV